MFAELGTAGGAKYEVFMSGGGGSRVREIKVRKLFYKHFEAFVFECCATSVLCVISSLFDVGTSSPLFS
jgi:hypothetical protein